MVQGSPSSDPERSVSTGSQAGKLSSLGLLSLTNATLAHPKNHSIVQRDCLRHVGSSACADDRKAEFVVYTAHES